MWCEYCLGYDSIFNHAEGDFSFVAGIDGGELSYEINSGEIYLEERKKIKYCPFCGRELEVAG